MTSHIGLEGGGLLGALAGSGFLGAFGGVLLALGLMVLFLFLVVLYVYTALAWSTIARKLGYDKPWLAWIPVVNLFLIPILAKKHWVWGLLLFVPFVNVVFLILWTWKIYEFRGIHGAWSLLFAGSLVPALAGVAFIGDLIVFGFAAWGGKGRGKAVRAAGKSGAVRKKAKKSKGKRRR